MRECLELVERLFYTVFVEINLMEVPPVEFEDNIIYLSPDEVDAFCPANPKWAAS